MQGWADHWDLPVKLGLDHGRSSEAPCLEATVSSHYPELSGLAAALRLCLDFFPHPLSHFLDVVILHLHSALVLTGTPA